jgi:hypothetical protein
VGVGINEDCPTTSKGCLSRALWSREAGTSLLAPGTGRQRSWENAVVGDGEVSGVPRLAWGSWRSAKMEWGILTG